MSSILRALKKLEEDGAGQGTQNGWPQGVSPYVRLERSGGHGRFRLVGLLLLAAVLLVGVGWLLSGHLPLSLEPKTAPGVTSAPALSKGAQTVEPARVRPVPAPVFLEEEEPRGSGRNEESLAVAVPLPDPEADPSATEAAAEPVDVGAPPPAPASLVAMEPPPAEGVDEALPLPPVLNSPDLSLQAVAWSEIPAQRVAVIGNRVVKEGDFVVGYVVVRINQDDIVVRKQGVLSRVLFNGR